MSGRTPPLGDELPLAGRLLAIDLGEVRVGLAVSDPGQVVASPAETLQVPRGAEEPALDALVNAAARHEAVALVVGLPRKLDGSEDGPARRARWFADQLRARTGLPVRLHDERFTTVEAERVLLQGDVSRAGRKSHIDQVAASVLLQGVLESQRTRRTPPAAPDPAPESAPGADRA